MPNKRTHSKLTMGLAVLSSPTLFISPAITLGIISTLPVNIFGTSIYLNPDMDIASNVGHLGKALGLEAYREFVSHRAGLRKSDWSELAKNPARIFLFSHIPFIGTLIRFLPCALAIFALQDIVSTQESVYPLWFLGMSASDTVHVVADIVSSKLKTRIQEKGVKSYRKPNGFGVHRHLRE